MDLKRDDKIILPKKNFILSKNFLTNLDQENLTKTRVTF